MPVYKDTTQGTWYTIFRYVDWTGKKKQKMKRGFKTKKEALKFARLGTQFVFKTQKACNLLNQSASITTCRLSDFLETDSRYKDKDDFLIGQEISLLESNLRINVTLTNRKFRNTVRDRYIDEILKEKENNLKKYGDANNIENPEMLDCLDLEG